MSLGESTFRFISVDQMQRLLSMFLDTGLALSESDYLPALTRRLSTILSADIAMFVKHDGVWSIKAGSFADSSRPSVDVIRQALDTLVAVTPAVVADRWTDARPWTFVGCATRPPLVVGLQGNWVSSSSTLLLMARHVSLMWPMQRATARAKSRLNAHRLARRLSVATGPQAVHETIVQRMAHAVDARIAALAVPDPVERQLSIVATYGYPLELVEHVRIARREGILGSVFQSGQVMHVRELSTLPEFRRRRPRYRTDSFVVMPIRTGKEVLGLICVTDRQDNEAFTRQDVAMLRVLTAPAALALDRERALLQAQNYALTAATDPVTGAFNRRHFHLRLEEEVQRSRRHQLPLAMLMIDIDDFKLINDSFGHLAGDAVLRDVADILRKSVRMFDVCARFGGEEFVIIMPGSTVESASPVAERIRELVERFHPSDPALTGLHLTVSVGLAVSSTGKSGHELIARADHALYLAKRAGKNCVSVDAQGEAPASDGAGGDTRRHDPGA